MKPRHRKLLLIALAVAARFPPFPDKLIHSIAAQMQRALMFMV